MSKRPAPASTEFSTLSVFTYKSRVTARFVPRTQLHMVAHAVIAGLFAQQPDSMFSITLVASGCCFLFDDSFTATFDAVMGSATNSQHYSCLYIHEGSQSRRGSEVAGTLAALSARLAQEALPVLNMTTIERNFLLVCEHHAERALTTLHRAIESESTATASGSATHVDPERALSAGMGTPQLVILAPSISICSLSQVELHTCAHALLWLLQLRPAEHLVTVFEMGGEVSLMFESDALHALNMQHPRSAEALLAAAGASLDREWRAISIVECAPSPSPNSCRDLALALTFRAKSQLLPLD